MRCSSSSVVFVFCLAGAVTALGCSDPSTPEPTDNTLGLPSASATAAPSMLASTLPGATSLPSTLPSGVASQAATLSTPTAASVSASTSPSMPSATAMPSAAPSLSTTVSAVSSGIGAPSASTAPTTPWSIDDVIHLLFNQYTQEDPVVGQCNGCHIGGDSPDPTIPATAPEFREFLLGYTATKCGDRKLLVPGDPDESALLLLYEGKCDDGTGKLLKMPDDGLEPYPENVAGIRGWIEAGGAL